MSCFLSGISRTGMYDTICICVVAVVPLVCSDLSLHHLTSVNSTKNTIIRVTK